MTSYIPEAKESSSIAMQKVAEAKLFDFLPSMFGKYYLLGESVVYSTMRDLCSSYSGGHWEYFDLTNGGRFMRLSSDAELEVSVTGNYFQERISCEGACLIVNLLVLGRLGESILDMGDEDAAEHLFNQRDLLMDFARTHGESEKIMRAID